MNADNRGIMEAKSVRSTLSLFNSGEGADDRFQVKKEGYLEIAIQKINGITRHSGFSCKFCRVTGDGRLLLDVNQNQENLVVEECTMTEPNLFRLVGFKETNRSSQGSVEVLCKSQAEWLLSEWLIAIETALRRRCCQPAHTEVDGVSGIMRVVEYNPILKGLPKVDSARRYQCFYYNGTFRVKHLDGPQTSSFVIMGLKVDEINLPMCFLIQTPGRSFLVKADDPEHYRKWLFVIHKDLKRDNVLQVKNVTEEASSGDVVKSHMLLGLTPQNMIRVEASYNVAQGVLETKDFAGIEDSLYIQRCVVPKRTEDDHHNLLFYVSLPNDLEERRTLKLCCCCDEKDVQMWLQAFEPNMSRLSHVIDKVMVQIEMRRIKTNEVKTEKKKRNVTFRDLRFLLNLDENQVEDVLLKVEEWPVGRLERCIQVALRVTSEPLIPYAIQKECIDLGREIFQDRIPSQSHKKRAEKILQKMPSERREILKKLVLHIHRLQIYQMGQRFPNYRLPQFSNRFSFRSFLSKVGSNHSNSNAINPVPRYQEVSVWARISKYIFRFDEQPMTPDECDSSIVLASQVIYAFHIQCIRAQKLWRCKNLFTRVPCLNWNNSLLEELKNAKGDGKKNKKNQKQFLLNPINSFRNSTHARTSRANSPLVFL